MSSSLDHPLVRDYLAELEAVLAALPPPQAADLREQISAHLDDALPPDADDDTVAGTLARLGPPAELAGVPPGPTAADLAARRARRRRIRRTCVILGIVALVAAAWPSYVAAMHSVGSLQSGGAYAWWYPRDAARQVRTEAEGIVQFTVPIRSGQQQGFVVDVYNPTSWTQTVLGAASDSLSPGSDYGQIAVSVRPVHGGAVALRSAAYGLPGVIPPHQSRAIRLMWVSTDCDSSGAGTIMDGLTLQVRVGWVTRTEVVSLNPTWGVLGPSTGQYALNAPACQ
jgi:hypothetical protein